MSDQGAKIFNSWKIYFSQNLRKVSFGKTMNTNRHNSFSILISLKSN